MNKPLCDSSIRELAPLLQAKQISPVELVTSCLERLEATEGSLNAYITTLGESALEQAKQTEIEIAKGRYRGPLHGIPFAVKDLYATKGILTTAGSKIFEDYVPDHDATTVARLKNAGAILIGKNNTHEFASGGTNENAHFGPTGNPWDPSRIPGGSSGGSAAAVASSSAIFSLGTDTGGSIRMPASLCGIVGIKATYGRVSRRGVFPLSWSLDHAGPLTKTVWDAASVLSVIAGYDPLDPTSSHEPVPHYVSSLVSGSDRPLAGLRIGYCQTYFFENLDPEVDRLVRQAMGVMEELGAQIVEVDIPYLDRMIQIQTLLSGPEMYSVHAEYAQTRPQDYGANILPRLQMSKSIPAPAYLEAQRLRQAYQSVWANVYQEIDLLIAPTTAIPAFPIGAKTIHLNGKDTNPRELAVIGRTSPSNFNGYPAISVPCGYTDAGLPVGLQIQGTPFDEVLVFQAAFAYEQATAWFSKGTPKVLTGVGDVLPRSMKLDLGALNPELRSLSTVVEVLQELGKILPLEAEPAAFFTPIKVVSEEEEVKLVG